MKAYKLVFALGLVGILASANVAYATGGNDEGPSNDGDVYNSDGSLNSAAVIRSYQSQLEQLKRDKESARMNRRGPELDKAKADLEKLMPKSDAKNAEAKADDDAVTADEKVMKSAGYDLDAAKISQAAYNALQTNHEKLVEKARVSRNANQDYGTQILQLKSTIMDARSDYKKYDAMVKEKDKQIMATQKIIDQLKSGMSAADFVKAKADLDATNKKLTADETKIASDKTDMATKDQMIKTLTDRVKKLEGKVATAKANLRTCQDDDNKNSQAATTYAKQLSDLAKNNPNPTASPAAGAAN